MTTLLDRPLPKSKTPHVSYADLMRRAVLGEFDDRRVMLLRGDLVEMPIPNPPHDAAMTLTHRVLLRIFDDSYLVRNQQGFPIGDDSEPIPDFCVVRGDVNDFNLEHPQFAELIVEVSDSTMTIDKNRKADLYASAQVPEYWIVDVNRRQLLVFREPSLDDRSTTGYRYRSLNTYQEADSLSPLTVPSASVKVTQLLPKVK